MKGTKVGDIVMWCKSPYTVIKIVDDKALLKQNFSIGSVLAELVDLDDITLINQNKDE
jgi:hypothetical protein